MGPRFFLVSGTLLLGAACSRTSGHPAASTHDIEAQVTAGAPPLVASTRDGGPAVRLRFTPIDAVTLPDGRRAAIVDGRRVLYDAQGAPSVVPGSVLLGSRIWSASPVAGGGFYFRAKRDGKPWEGEVDGPGIWRAERFDGELAHVADWTPGHIEMGPGFILSAASEQGPTEAHDAETGRPRALPVPDAGRALLHTLGFGLVVGKEQGFYTRGESAVPLGPVRHVVAGPDAFYFLGRELPSDYPQDLATESRRRLLEEADRSWKKVDGTGTVSGATASEAAPFLADEHLRSSAAYALRLLGPPALAPFETEAERLARSTPLPDTDDEPQRQDVSVLEGADGTRLALYTVQDHRLVVRDLKTQARVFYQGLPRLVQPRLLEASAQAIRYEAFEERNGLPSQAVFVDLDRRSGAARTSTLRGRLLTPVLTSPRGIAIDAATREAWLTTDSGRTWEHAGVVPVGLRLESPFSLRMVWCGSASCRIGAVDIAFDTAVQPPDAGHSQ